MNPYTLSALICSVTMFALSAHVFYNDKKSPLNRILALCMVIAAAAAFSEFMYRPAESLAKAGYWAKLSGLWPLMMSLMLHFYLLFSGSRSASKKSVLAALYLPAVFFTYIFLFTDLLRQQMVLTHHGYTRGVYLNGGWEAGVAIWSVLISIIALVISARNYINAEKGRRKKQALILLINSILIFLIPPLTEGFLPRAGYNIELEAPTILSAVLAILMAVAIVRYGMFRTAPEHMIRLLMEAVPGFIILLSPDGKIIQTNNYFTEIFRYPPEQLKGMLFDRLFRPGDSNALRLHSLLSRYGKLKNEETVLITAAGEKIDILISAEQIRDNDGEIVGYVFAAANIMVQKQLSIKLSEALDITEKNYIQLKSLDLLKNNFISAVSHELRTPLTAIKGYTSLLKMEAQKKNDVSSAEMLEAVERQSNRLVRMVNDILDMSKIEKGTFSINKSRFDITETLSDAAAEAMHTAVPKNIALNKVYTGDKREAMIDPERLRQVFTNILTNAIKFTQAGGVITMDISEAMVSELPEGADAEKKYFIISFSDNGPGMTKDTLEKIFDRFYQSNDIGENKSRGAGIGLSIAKEIVTAHQGVIKAYSEGPGSGAVFKVYIPAA